MKLQSKVLIPILSVLVLSYMLISVLSVSVMRNSTDTILKSDMVNLCDSVSHQVDLSNKITDSVLDMMNQKNIALAQAVAVIIAENPDNLKDARMAELCNLFGVSEIHVTDEKGILLWGSVPAFFGLDFYTNDQTRPLTVILANPSLTIAQEPQPRAVDGTLFQYINVSRIDQPGIVQVGVEMKTIDDIKLSMNVQNSIANIRIGQGGGVFLLDADKMVVASSSDTIMGANMKDQEWADTMFTLQEGRIRHTYNEVEYDSYFRHEHGYMIVTYLPVSEINGYATWILGSIIPLGIAAALIVSFIAVWLIHWITVKVNWYENILDSIPFLICVTDTNRKMAFINKPVEDFLSRSRSDLLGRPCSVWNVNICNTENCAIERLEKGLATTAFSQGGKDYLADGSFLTDRRNRIVGQVEIIQDITELLQLQKKLEIALEEANSASSAKSNFLANMSHEIRTPMNAIIGMTNIGKSADDIERKNYSLMRIEDASHHLLGVINDILDVSKIESGKFELSLAEFNFEKMLVRVVNVTNFRMNEKNQKFTVYVDRTIPQNLIGDDQRLAQVITNLLGNAVKFTPEHGAISLNTYLLGEQDGVYEIRISVKDTGIGISPEQQCRLFQSFQQAEESTSRKFGGTGLGLAISKSIVEMMGGRIWVESELGKGSTFSFTVKMQRGEAIVQSPGHKEIDWKNMRMLVVDDDLYILQDFKGIVEKFGAHCDTADNGIEALRLIEQNDTYNLFFIDWKMPGMDGIELTKRLKKKASKTSNSFVVMVSAAEYGIVAGKAKEAGVDSFLQKPLFPSIIADITDEYFGSPLMQTEESDVGIDGAFEGRRILLCEDVEINREIVLALLEPTLLEIDCATNGKEAVSMFSAAPDKYEMIFMDIQMPEMDGYEATRRIRAMGTPQAQFIPIVAMTANVFKEDVEKCLASGMNDHVGKPLDIDEVIGKLRQYLP
ncbi:MAG: response regulator [Coriobacteriia bacterium]|nr:response regulator [Coriobacteriia bacterium]